MKINRLSLIDPFINLFSVWFVAAWVIFSAILIPLKEAHAETNKTNEIIALASGQSHICALNSAGVVRCWGGNRNGTIGDGTLFDRFLPVDPLGPTIGVTALSAGLNSTCAITSSKEVQCWPWTNFSGTSLKPVVIAGITTDNPPIQLSVGGNAFACAVFLDKTVKCWGRGTAVASLATARSPILQPL